MKRTLGDPVIKFFISVVGIVLISIVLKELQHIFIPFVVAYFLYFIFEPLNKFLAKWKFPSTLSMVIDIFIVITIVWGLSRILIDAFGKFGQELPQYEIKLNNIISTTAASFGITDSMLTNFNLSEILQTLDYGGLASGFFSSTISIFSSVFFVLFFFIFISSGHNKIYDVIKTRYVAKNTKASLKKMKKKNIQLGTEDRAEISRDNIEKIQQALLQHWHELPQQFITSSVGVEGREEILQFINEVKDRYFKAL